MDHATWPLLQTTVKTKRKHLERTKYYYPNHNSPTQYYVVISKHSNPSFS